jgi:peptide/nickel transport system substrate-binding protein
VIQAQLARVGVALELETLEYALVRERLLEGDFDAVVINAFGQIATHVLLGADSPLGYRNVEVRAVVARIREAFDPAASDRLHVELAGLLREEPAGVFLYNPVFSTVARRRVRGLSSPWREDPLWITDELHFDGPGDG